jgi:hypothetical protein
MMDFQGRFMLDGTLQIWKPEPFFARAGNDLPRCDTGRSLRVE